MVCAILLCSWLVWLASEWIGRGAEIIGHGWNPGVRGATISAVSSSLPELFVTLLFLIILQDQEGFLGGLATMTGSAIFNILLIPGAMGVVSLVANESIRGEIDRKVVLWDGAWLLLVQFIALAFLHRGAFGIFESCVLLLLYAGYVYTLFAKNKKEKALPFSSHRHSRIKQLWKLVVLGIIILGVSCFFLVEACVKLSEIAGWGLAATALIITAAATSLPDTFISIRDSLSGASVEGVSNAFGSNIFDLCVALGFPVLLYSAFNGPIELSDELQTSLIQLWHCMIFLTVMATGVLLSSKKLGWKGGGVLILIYLFFVASVLLGYWS